MTGIYRRLCLSLALICPALFAGDLLEIGWGDTGLVSLRHHGREFLARGKFMVNAAEFTDAAGHIVHGNVKSQVVDNPKLKMETLIFDWGIVTVRYEGGADRLGLKIEVWNKTASVLSALSLDALVLQLPSPPKEYNGNTPMLGTNIGAPTVLPLNYQAGSILVVNEDVVRPLLLGMPWALNRPVNTVFPIRLNTGREPMYPNSLPYIRRPIAPGATDTFNISVRFSASANDVLERYARTEEFGLHWTDRRPIGSLILATAATNWVDNPRGWLLDTKINVHTDSGLAAFHSRLLAWATHSIDILKKMNAQGMITWDIEGEEFPHATTYVGDPTLISDLAPEMAPIVDEYFKRFRDAGLRVGVAIRPQRFEKSGAVARQVDVSDPAAELIRKISFAEKRWGATLFYIDSNGDSSNPMGFETIAKVARIFPDVLLIPEHKNAAYYSKCAPYSELRQGVAETPSFVTAIYPAAFSVINTADASIDKNVLQSAVNRGDILMFRAWFDDPQNTSVKALYARQAH